MTFDDLAIHGDVKTFAVGAVTEEADEIVGSGQGVGDVRLKATLTGQSWDLEVHHAVSMISGSAGGSGVSTGVALTAPELVDLTWQPDLGDGLVVRGRTDRLAFSWSPGPLRIVVGRQPITFGTGLVFTPRDIVNPFFPATIDSEYKPGVDAMRVDAYAGTSSRLTAVLAYTGVPPYQDGAPAPSAGDYVAALDGSITVGVTDLQAFVGHVRGDVVLGAGTISALGPVGVHADATFTLPELAGEDPFVRAVAGADWRPTATTTLSGEAYVQTFGATDPVGYLALAASPRFLRGEVWLLGRTYASVALAQEITPLVSASAAVIANVEDPSALVAPSLSWSIADEAALGAGGYLGLGEKPDWVPGTFAGTPLTTGAGAPALIPIPNSEFGLYPYAFFLNLRSYF